MAAAAGAVLIATVFAAVYHAEVVAHRTGEPFGTLVLALAVTVIEAALIVSVMLAAPAEKAGLARDTVFAAVMIVCNGIVGLCLLWGGARHHEQGFQVSGASAALAVLAALTTLTLILPNVVGNGSGPVFNTSQLIFAAIVSLVLYGAFVFIQTVRHRDYFLDDKEEHARAALQQGRPDQRGLAARVTGRDRGAGESFSPRRWKRDWRGSRCRKPWSASSSRRLVLLPEGLAALRARACQPAADEPEPGARIGAGDHRPYDSGGRRRVDRDPPAARARASAPRIRSCWR